MEVPRPKHLCHEKALVMVECSVSVHLFHCSHVAYLDPRIEESSQQLCENYRVH